LKNAIKQDVYKALSEAFPEKRIEVEMGASVVSGRHDAKSERLPGVKNIIAVGSGKGGVGKSTVAVNLAIALAQSGAKVGLLDADLYGPSIPMMLGLQGEAPFATEGDKIAPLEKFELKVFSIGFLIKSSDAVAWRGPLLHKAIQQFLEDVAWGELDYMVVDLPPGTGDVQLSLTQLVPVTSAVVVTTPQDVAFADVLRAIRMFELTKVPLLGVVENMAYFVCNKCSTVHYLFGNGRVKEECEKRGLEYLGALPLDATVSPMADEGKPIVISVPDSQAAKAFFDITTRIASRQSVFAMK
jgi:ATP-binding protein involved in chromosome partitioning